MRSCTFNRLFWTIFLMIYVVSSFYGSTTSSSMPELFKIIYTLSQSCLTPARFLISRCIRPKASFLPVWSVGAVVYCPLRASASTLSGSMESTKWKVRPLGPTCNSPSVHFSGCFRPFRIFQYYSTAFGLSGASSYPCRKTYEVRFWTNPSVHS